MLSEQAAYQECYRWTRTTYWSCAVFTALLLVAVFAPLPLVFQALIIVGCGYFFVTSATYILSRKVAFRVAQEGVTLGGSPFRYQATTRFHPWSTIEKIFIWDHGPVRVIGLQRGPDAPPISADGSGSADRPAFGAPANGIAAGAARKINSWVLDRAQLARAVAAFAPGVSIEDLTTQASVLARLRR